MPPERGEVLAVIPAAGRARRLGRLPCSKEILPVPYGADGAPRALCCHLLERLRRAGVRRALIVTTREKLDIPRCLGSGDEAGIALAYLLLEASASVPETLDRARPFVTGCTVALGFPDVVFEPADAFGELLARHAAGGADVVLGLFPAAEPWRTDMVELAADGAVRAIHVRPETTSLTYNWLLAIWSERFTAFLASAVAAGGGNADELPLGAVLEAAIEGGLRVVGVPFPEGSYRDVGTPRDLWLQWGLGDPGTPR